MLLSTLSTRTNSLLPWFALSETEQDRLWQRCQNFTPAGQWTAYLNRLAWAALRPWFAEQYPQFACCQMMATVWEFISGFSITWQNATGSSCKSIVIPSDTLDVNELRIPQEWIDIPDWVGDYYFAAQVNPEMGQVQLWGYATHQQIKQQGSYCDRDRTYTMAYRELIQDFNVLWVAQKLCPDEELRCEVAAIPPLAPAQAEALITRFGQSAIAVPRLEIPFALWAALIDHPRWQQQLHAARLGQSAPSWKAQWSPVAWLRSGLSVPAEQMGWRQLQLVTDVERRGATISSEAPQLVRSIVIEDHTYELTIESLSELSDCQTWRFSLRSVAMLQPIPMGYTLRLLNEDQQPFPGNEMRSDGTLLQLQVMVELEPGEGLVWQVEPATEMELEYLWF
jgi:Protein of unknown function (DUF1822)